MSALGRGLLSGLAGGLKGVDDYVNAETDYNRQMTLEEFRAAKEMEREKFRQSFEREQKHLDRAIETSKMGMEQVNAERGFKIRERYNEIMADYYKNLGGTNKAWKDGDKKSFSAEVAASLHDKYFKGTPFEMYGADARGSLQDYIAALEKYAGSANPSAQASVEQALAEAREWRARLSEATTLLERDVLSELRGEFFPDTKVGDGTGGMAIDDEWVVVGRRPGD